jgi:NAD(P)-dependent dehydrogenase (short-subunit alcohol dehydrogenase family)
MSVKGKRRPFQITFAGIARIGGCGEPDEVAAVTEFLLSDDASFVTSSLYTADGGTMWL